MSALTKVSDITPEYLAEYLRIYDVDSTVTDQLQTSINVAKAFIKSYTGQPDIDAFPEFVEAALLICADMYDNRTAYVGKANVNKAIGSILDLHSINLLVPEDEESREEPTNEPGTE